MQRERLELNVKQSVIAILVAVCIIYLSASWAIDSGKILPHVIAYLAAYYGLYFGWELIKKVRKSHVKANATRRPAKADRR